VSAFNDIVVVCNILIKQSSFKILRQLFCQSRIKVGIVQFIARFEKRNIYTFSGGTEVVHLLNSGRNDMRIAQLELHTVFPAQNRLSVKVVKEITPIGILAIWLSGIRVELRQGVCLQYAGCRKVINPRIK